MASNHKQLCIFVKEKFKTVLCMKTYLMEAITSVLSCSNALKPLYVLYLFRIKPCLNCFGLRAIICSKFKYSPATKLI